jgi:hypothetical protein
MSYDRIWIESTEHPGGLLERYEAEKKNLSDYFYANYKRLRAKGDFVVLSAGKNCLLDEMFVFESGTDAQEFYERGYRKWERFAIDAEEGFGFQEVSLYRDGYLVATKSCPPSEPNELNRAETIDWWEKVGKHTCDVLDENE